MSVSQAIERLHTASIDQLVRELTRSEHQANLIRTVIRERRRAEAEERVAGRPAAPPDANDRG